jgi:hypothetical protein
MNSEYAQSWIFNNILTAISFDSKMQCSQLNYRANDPNGNLQRNRMRHITMEYRVESIVNMSLMSRVRSDSTRLRT